MDPVILVVDDNEDNRVTLAMRLETCGYTKVVSAGDGREALEMMRRRPVDLVLLDIMMPQLDAYSMLQEMNTDVRLRRIAVIMISAVEDLNNVIRCIELGATDHLTKPFNPVLLKTRVDKCIEQAHYEFQEAAYHGAQTRFSQPCSPTRLRALKQDGKLSPRHYDEVAVSKTFGAASGVRIGIDHGPLVAGIMGETHWAPHAWAWPTSAVDLVASAQHGRRPLALALSTSKARKKSRSSSALRSKNEETATARARCCSR
jgi:CheY-like chemotaxis protein